MFHILYQVVETSEFWENSNFVDVADVYLHLAGISQICLDSHCSCPSHNWSCHLKKDTGIETCEFDEVNKNTNCGVGAQASFLEIYNEEIRDLLATEKNLKYDIKMCDSKGADIYVTNLKVPDTVLFKLIIVLDF